MNLPPAEREEFLNTASHGLGAALGALGGVWLIVSSASSGDVWRIMGVTVFSLTLILMYTASTLYHASRREAVRSRLKVADHACIYLLIAGTYTPFTLGPLRGVWGWSLFGVIWGLAVAGVVFKLFLTGRFPRLSTSLYLAMGWLVVVAAGPLARNLSGVTLGWLVAGGLAYTVGTLFYHSRRIPYAHAVWHLFVLAGSLCHGVAVALL